MLDARKEPYLEKAKDGEYISICIYTYGLHQGLGFERQVDADMASVAILQMAY
jgi:hypothetical protein